MICGWSTRVCILALAILAAATTHAQQCGNGPVEGDEQCGDSSACGGDGCAANCTQEDRRTSHLAAASGIALTATPSITPTPTSTPFCTGDCNGDGVIDPTELADCTGIKTFPETQFCPACDSNMDGVLSVTEVQRAALNFNLGCPGNRFTPTPSLTAPADATSTFSPPITTPTLTATPQVVCSGDCASDGAVTVDEIVKGVNVALGIILLAECPSFDNNADEQLSVDELVRAINNVLNGCT